ncbi:hypothetical protein CTAYLR_005385 [Chrysophaeum taylorii]|uniref:Carbohydrate sulfotransferase n=1 Tax=Chrysophaeum taylorii TaxID=2483200 RepID=A0AAD7U9I6_9STRA|nr:hypothetical protein CTAYLR_005385 [Chrysophaeum taylorii]
MLLWVGVACANTLPPGCREFYNASRPGLASATVESLRSRQLRKSHSLTTRRNWAGINGTIYVYAVNRKAGSKSWMGIMDELRRNGFQERGPKVVYFTFVRHPYGRLASALEEIVQRHDALCRRIPYCQRVKGLGEGQFEAFTKAVLLEEPFSALENDGLSYHTFSQMHAIAALEKMDFVGHLETMREDALRLFGASISPDDLLRRVPMLERMLATDAMGSRYRSVQLAQNRLMNASNYMNVFQIAKRYYAQDLFCFNYSMARPSDVADLQWHRDSTAAMLHGRRRRHHENNNNRGGP